MKRDWFLAIALAAGAVLLSGPVMVYAQEPAVMRAVGNFSQNKKQVDGAERPFFDALAKNLGAKIKVEFNPMDVLSIQAADALRLMRSGAFDVMSIQIGMASRDDPFFEGVDLIGVAPACPRRLPASYRTSAPRRCR